MRGAIAVALVYYYFDPRGQAQDSHRATIIATTLLLVLFSTVVFSAATKPLLEFMLGPQGEWWRALTSHLAWLSPSSCWSAWWLRLGMVGSYVEDWSQAISAAVAGSAPLLPPQTSGLVYCLGIWLDAGSLLLVSWGVAVPLLASCMLVYACR